MSDRLACDRCGAPAELLQDRDGEEFSIYCIWSNGAPEDGRDSKTLCCRTQWVASREEAEAAWKRMQVPE